MIIPYIGYLCNKDYNIEAMLSDFANKFPKRKFSHGEIILNAGDTPPSMFYLREGYVRRFITSIEGQELTIHIFDKDTIFPLSWGLNNEIPSFSLSAIGEVVVNLVPQEAFMKYLGLNPQELLSLTKRMTYAVEGLAKRVEILSLEKADIRVKSTLSYLSKHFGEKLPFTHEDLATLTGLSRERVSIEMKKLKDQKNISYSRGEIVIKITD